MTEPNVEIDVLFVGQTGVGKSSLINMIIGTERAEVSNNARPCTTQTNSYSTALGAGLQCRLWDTRGLGEAADTHDRGWVTKIVDHIRVLASQQAQELRKTLRDRTRLGMPIVVWCMDFAKIDVMSHWQQFGKVYVEYCERRAIPVVVINRVPPNAIGWENRCKNHLQKLNLWEGPNGMDVPLLGVRRYRDVSSPVYKDDSVALKDLISRFAKR